MRSIQDQPTTSEPVDQEESRAPTDNEESLRWVPMPTGCRTGRTGRFQGVGSLAAGLLIVVAVVQIPTSAHSLGSVGRGQGIVQTDNFGAGPPVADWLDDIIEFLEDIANNLDDAWVSVGGQNGPLDEPALSHVAGALADTEATIDKILNAGQYPSLTPSTAGSIETSIDPQTLPNYADNCLTLANEALAEANSPVVDHDVIGSRLKTIEHLISRGGSHNYKTLAGIR